MSGRWAIFGDFSLKEMTLRGLALVLAKKFLKFPERGHDVGLGLIKWLIWRKNKNLNVTAPYIPSRDVQNYFQH